VSNNSGGNSACGDMIINYFHAKPYLDYQCKWKRSDEYLALTKSWGGANKFYESQPVGSIISFESSINKPSRHLKNRFQGQVFVVVGPQTFSSAIMFATIVKDNHLATLVGQTPENGHPNHFGEMYGSQTPNTKLELQFGVKEWIRPSGEREENHLTPDKMIDLQSVKDVPDLIARILH
jgi:C-terminal processing protease CtpA/Prc